MFEKIKNAITGKSLPLPPDATPAPTLYTQLDDGTFQEQLDIMYPPGTVFYVKSPDGSFELESMVSPATGVAEVTEEFVITTAVDFLVAKGYLVLPPNAPKEEIQPGNNFEHCIEMSMHLDQLRGMVVSHVSNRATIDAMCDLIEKIKTHV